MLDEPGKIQGIERVAGWRPVERVRLCRALRVYGWRRHRRFDVVHITILCKGGNAKDHYSECG